MLYDATQTVELELNKEIRQPRANDRKYSIGDYLLLASREITELKKFLDEHKVTLYSPNQLFDDENRITTIEAAKAEFETNIASNPRLLSTVENFIRNICTFLKEYNFLYKELPEEEFDFFDRKEKELEEDTHEYTYLFLTSGVFSTYKNLAHSVTIDIETQANNAFHEIVAHTSALLDDYLSPLIKHCDTHEKLKSQAKLLEELATLKIESVTTSFQQQKSDLTSAKQIDSAVEAPPAAKKRKLGEEKESEINPEHQENPEHQNLISPKFNP